MISVYSMGPTVEVKTPRCYLGNIQIKFPLPFQVLPDIQLTVPAVPENRDRKCSYSYCLEMSGNSESRPEIIFEAIVYGINLGSKCCTMIELIEYDNYKIYGDYPLWKEYRQVLDEEAIHFVIKNHAQLIEYFDLKKYNRVANAIRLHQVATTTNSDLALLGFMGALESLFLDNAPELPFRLSLYIGKFLGNDVNSQIEYFQKVKDLYEIRSKIAHGDRLPSKARDFYEIAISAEDICRKCIKKIFDNQLLDEFEDTEKSKAFLKLLLFHSFEEAVIQIKNK